MNGPTFDVKLPYRTYCNLPDCGKPVYHVFRKQINGIMCNFCSPDHLRIGEERAEEKKKLNIRLGVPEQTNTDDYESGNIPGEDGE